MRWARTSVRTRTTLTAVAVVAVALVLGAAVLLLTVRDSLRDGVAGAAELRADELVAQIEAGVVPTSDPDDDPDDEPDDLVWQVLDGDGRVLSASQPLAVALPDDGEDEDVRIRGADHAYLVVTADAEPDDGPDGGSGDDEYVVVVAASLEDVDETTSALLTPLLVGLPLLLLVVAGTTWLVVTRSLAPVERIRGEVDRITGSRLDLRVPEPPSRDEIARLARTMNRMLERLQAARDRQEQFVGDASHELRSPLASIRQVAEVATAHPDAVPPGELAETVLEEAVRMQQLVEQLLVLTRAGEGRGAVPRGEVDLDDLALREARRVVTTGVAVDTSGIGPGRVHGDAVALGQVVRNLVDNAVRHARTSVAVAVVQSAAGVRLTVEDDGAGVPVEDRERVFERFVRLDEARARDAGGSGLGLAIVREVVAGHGGAVRVEQAPSGGARFVVELPS